MLILVRSGRPSRGGAAPPSGRLRKHHSALATLDRYDCNVATAIVDPKVPARVDAGDSSRRSNAARPAKADALTAASPAFCYWDDVASHSLSQWLLQRGLCP